MLIAESPALGAAQRRLHRPSSGTEDAEALTKPQMQVSSRVYQVKEHWTQSVESGLKPLTGDSAT